jgi:hypothetical protein
MDASDAKKAVEALCREMERYEAALPRYGPGPDAAEQVLYLRGQFNTLCAVLTEYFASLDAREASDQAHRRDAEAME